MISIEVLYALPHEQTILKLSMPQGSTVGEAIQQSGMLEKYPEIDLVHNKLGIYGKASKLEAVLQDRDRVEIYRPLRVDPKEARRLRAQQMKQA
ncbi:MAG: RnfH family protein [Gallionellaceae bacterium]|nr:RnfH family protein [Gallionellaceae bacterium]